MQNCVNIYSNIRTTHKYGNILQMKAEKYLPQLDTNRDHTSAKMY
jgi:hypothetical protein